MISLNHGKPGLNEYDPDGQISVKGQTILQICDIISPETEICLSVFNIMT